MASRFQQKLIIPSSTSVLVERDDLLIQLDQAITSKRIIALAAPAGWGKTTLLAQWVARGSLPVIWYTLDATDRDPRVFLDYLVAALAAVAPGLAEIESQLASAPPQTLGDLYRATAHEIAGVAEPFALVLDDFHTLEDDLSAALPGTSLIFELLSSLAAYAPCCHLVFASWSLPSLRGLARLGAQQLAARFDYTALQWTAGDVQRLAGVTRGVALAEADAERLVASMSGWVTGIVLSLEQVDGGGDIALALTDDTGPIYSFFAEQLTAPLSPELQRFLEDTSVLEELSPQRCNLLRGTQDSVGFLDDLARRSLFISRRGSWLHHHSLFREFLRSRLARDPAREQALLRRTGDIYRDEDDIERALACYLAAGAGAAAVELLHEAVPHFRKSSRQTSLLACFERIGQLRSLPPALLLDQARVYSDLALWERAYLALQLAETIGSEEIRWEARLLEADVAFLQGHPGRARKALEDLPQAALPPRLRFAYYRIIGRVHILAEDIDAAIQALEMAQTVAPAVTESANDPSALASIYDNLGQAYLVQGNRQLAVRYLQRADACWQASGNNGRRTMTLNNLGMVIQEEGRYAEARALFESGLALSRQTVRRREEATLLCSIADLDIIEDRLEEAQARFQQAYEIARRHDIPFLAIAAAVGGLWSAALIDGLDAAQEWESRVDLHREAPAPPEVRGRRALAQGLLSLRRADPDLARMDTLAQEATANERALPFPDRAYLPLLRATAAFKRGGWNAAAPDWDLFAQAAAGWSDTALRRLLAPHQAIFEAAMATSPLAQRCIGAWGKGRIRGFASRGATAPDQLTPREYEILHLVAQGLSNAQVAERLIISPRTVETHLTAIYGKLGVESRGAATRFALEHKLV